MDAFELELPHIDPLHLSTDRHVRKTAKALVATALKQIGERRARKIWDAALRTVVSHGETPLIGDCEEYIRRVADEYVQLSTPELRDAYRRVIEHRLKSHVTGYSAVPAGILMV